jgi:hypothetical protein|tara:strand:- start:275 stop:484 length:210 start_codon:yes stop_codon:yes gene_type:complete
MMVKVTILNQTGHTVLDLSVEETIETINNHPTHWAYVNGELMTVEQIMALPEDDIEDVVLTQAIVGGDY